MGFVTARREKSYLRLGLAGHSKAGKSRTALILGTGLIEYLASVNELFGNGRAAVIDTEHESSRKYAKASDNDNREDAYDFDVLYLKPPYSPEAYIKAMKEAEKAQYSVLIIDQITHEWDGPGGILEIHSKLVEDSTHKNGYILWRDVIPRHNAFIETFLAYPGHVICTMRSKVKYRFNKETKQIDKLGYKPIQKGEILYEFDGVGSLDSKHTMRMDPSRCPVLDNAVFPTPTKELAYAIGEWLVLGVSQTEVKRSPLDKERARTIRLLAKQIGIEDDDLLASLTERGVSEVEELTPTQADEMIQNMNDFIEAQKRKAKREEQRKTKASDPSLPGQSDSTAQPSNTVPVDPPFGNQEIAEQQGETLLGMLNGDSQESNTTEETPAKTKPAPAKATAKTRKK